MKHDDDHDDFIRSKEGAHALMAAIFVKAREDAADPEHRFSALRWLLSKGAEWAIEYGGADPAVYRASLLAIKVQKPARVWVDDEHFLGPLCKRGHEYKDTGQTLRRTYKDTSHCVECDRITGAREHKRKQERRRAALELQKPSEAELSPMYYLGNLCQRGHGYEGSPFSVRYRLNHTCVECYRASRKSKAQRRKLEEAV